ncbi:hypothetical protein OG948_58660 (plasmid) [Embleya sp. NBC_00888]|uniref:hypothetical protein n=1 Tax=Embleya sp. NBC_00888 TaxID=2975960 RepID=UPI002F910975|nr:hypothetical protein OG948_58660 [Embleya sp. NBC_00888]
MGMQPTRFSHNSPGLYNPGELRGEPAHVAAIARALWAAPGAGRFHVPVAPARRGQASMSVHPVVVFSAGESVGVSIHPRTELDAPHEGEPIAYLTLRGSAVRPEVAVPTIRAILAGAPETRDPETPTPWDVAVIVGAVRRRPAQPTITTHRTDPPACEFPAHATVSVSGRDIHVGRRVTDGREESTVTPRGWWTYPALAAVVEAMAQPALDEPERRMHEEYAPVVDALNAAGHVARVAVDAAGYPLILLVLPDGSRLHIADTEHDDELPDNLCEVGAWTAMHHRWDDPPTDYIPQDLFRIERSGPADDAHMVEAVTAYVHAMREYLYRRPPTT